MTDKIVVLSTCENADDAARIARSLVERRLAACVNIVPGVQSIYHWKGAVEQASEVLMVIKTSRALFSGVRAEIERLHSYELPEAIALPIVDGSERYLEWLAAGLKQTGGEPR
jgi:periplasmic divalent cation tolerance protein